MWWILFRWIRLQCYAGVARIIFIQGKGMKGYPKICDVVIQRVADGSTGLQQAYLRCVDYLGHPTNWADVALTAVIVIPMVMGFVGFVYILNKY